MPGKVARGRSSKRPSVSSPMDTPRSRGSQTHTTSPLAPTSEPMLQAASTNPNVAARVKQGHSFNATAAKRLVAAMEAIDTGLLKARPLKKRLKPHVPKPLPLDPVLARYQAVAPIAADIRAHGITSASGICRELNRRAVHTARGRQWSADPYARPTRSLGGYRAKAEWQSLHQDRMARPRRPRCWSFGSAWDIIRRASLAIFVATCE
jgi:hypothetical protein